MAKEDFKQMSYVGEFKYLDLQKPKMHNGDEFIKCERNTGMGEYSITWELSSEDADAFIETCKDHYEDCAKRNKKIKMPMGQVHKLKELDNGLVQVTAKLGAKDKDGNPRTPKVIDKTGQDIPEEMLELYAGTKGAIMFGISVTRNPGKNNHGITAFINKVQIREPVYTRDDDDSVFVYEKPLAAIGETENPLGLSPTKNKEAKKASEELFDDDIPF